MKALLESLRPGDRDWELASAIDPDRLRALVAAHTQLRQWGVFGEPRVNVLELNLALDAQH